MKKLHSQRVAPAGTTRKARFRAALSLAGLTASAWAEREQITESYLSMILAGHRQNADVEQKIAAFTEKHLRIVA
jgi:hypothetical protein